MSFYANCAQVSIWYHGSSANEKLLLRYVQRRAAFSRSETWLALWDWEWSECFSECFFRMIVVWACLYSFVIWLTGLLYILWIIQVYAVYVLYYDIILHTIYIDGFSDSLDASLSADDLEVIAQVLWSCKRVPDRPQEQGWADWKNLVSWASL